MNANQFHGVLWFFSPFVLEINYRIKYFRSVLCSFQTNTSLTFTALLGTKSTIRAVKLPFSEPSGYFNFHQSQILHLVIFRVSAQDRRLFYRQKFRSYQSDFPKSTIKLWSCTNNSRKYSSNTLIDSRHEY